MIPHFLKKIIHIFQYIFYYMNNFWINNLNFEYDITSLNSFIVQKFTIMIVQIIYLIMFSPNIWMQWFVK